MGRQPKPPAPRAHNPIRSQREIRAPTPILHKSITTAAVRPPKRLCPNKECSDPKIVEGVCHSCGTVVDDSNIVAEVSFGEDSRGANIALGSYVGEGQGSARNLGSAFRRVAGGGGEGSSRDATINDGKLI
jgi:transcription factor IIIB subunit 2